MIFLNTAFAEVAMSNSPPDKRRSTLLRLLDAFFQEENIKWVLGLGVCILLGSSLRLVTLHWQGYTPVWKYLILLAYTGGVFALGEFGYHRMGLRKTGTVLMSLTVLLIPISFLALHWIQPNSETSWIEGLPQLGLVVLLGVNLIWSTYAANHIFRHFLRKSQPTFLVSYLILCLAAAIIPGLPVAWKPVLALALWAVFAAGTVKVNRHIFWLTEEHRLTRIFGFFPIALLGSLFAVVFQLGIAAEISTPWMGLICTLVSLPVLLTADTVARVFEQRTGGIVRPIPWSISGPLAVGVLMTAAGVLLAMTGLAVSPPNPIVIPTAILAAIAMGLIAARTKNPAFVGGLILCVMVVYQTTPILFKELVLQLRDQAAAAVREERLPYAFYGLTYAPLIALFTAIAAILHRRGERLFAGPLQFTAMGLSLLLLGASFLHPAAILPVCLLLCPLLALSGVLFRQPAYLIPAVVSFLAAAYGLPGFAQQIRLANITPVVSLLVWTAAAGLLLVPGMWVDRWFSRFPGSNETPTWLGVTQVCQRFSLGATIVALGWWLVRFASPAMVAELGPETLAAVWIIILLSSHTLRWLTPGLGELTLVCALGLVQLGVLHYGGFQVQSLERLCGMLLIIWVLSYLLAQIPRTRVAQAFGLATFRVSLNGLVVLFGLFTLNWFAQHAIAPSQSPLNPLWGLLMLAWGFDAARRSGEPQLSMLVWGSFFLFVTATLNRWLGLDEARYWWMLAWTVTGLVLVGLRQVMRLPPHNLSTAADTTSLAAVERQVPAWIAPLDLLLPVLFLVIGAISLAWLDWGQRISGLLALAGLLTIGRCRFRLDLSEMLLPLLNWHLLVACIAYCVGADGFVYVFELGRDQIASFGMFIAAVGGISVLCFETRLRKRIQEPQLIDQFGWLFAQDDSHLRQRIKGPQIVDLHRLLLMCLVGGLLLAVMALKSPAEWNRLDQLFAVVSWVAIALATFMGAVRNQDQARAWNGQAVILGGMIYGMLCGLLAPSVAGTPLVFLVAGLCFWLFGRWAKSDSRLAILSSSFERIGYWLPMAVLPLTLLAQSITPHRAWVGETSLPILGAAAFYFWRAVEQRQLGTAVISLVMLNLATLLLWKDLSWSDPQLFLMPIGLSFMLLTKLMQREIPTENRERLRLIGALVILVSPVFHILSEGSWLHILTLMVASTVLSLVAIGLRNRSLLYTSTAFLVADLVALVARGSQDEPAVLWIVGVLLGASIIGLGAFFENHRETVLARLRGLAAELEQGS
jgi:hypothetical protein